MAIVNVPISDPQDDSRFTQTQAYGQGRMGRTDLPSWYLPQEVTGDIFAKVEENASLLGLGQRITVSMNENVMRYGGTDPEAGQVGVGTSYQDREGHEKPLSGFAFGEEKSFSPVKFATIVTVSQEFLNANPDRLYSELAGKLTGALGRQVELATFHNRNALTGSTLLGTENNGSVVGSIPAANRLELDLSENLVEQIVAGYDLIISDEEANLDFTGFASHPQFRGKLALARDLQGNLAFTAGDGSLGLTQGAVNLNASLGSLLGLPVAFGKAVGGRIGNYGGTDIKLIGGDFSQFAYGFADQISVKVSDQTTVRGVSMWETNQIAILAECTFGWYVNVPASGTYPFVAWSLAADEPDAG